MHHRISSFSLYLLCFIGSLNAQLSDPNLIYAPVSNSFKVFDLDTTKNTVDFYGISNGSLNLYRHSTESNSFLTSVLDIFPDESISSEFLEAADMNSDGTNDFIFWSGIDKAIILMLSDGNNDEYQKITVVDVVSSFNLLIRTGDMDNDGLVDIVLTSDAIGLGILYQKEDFIFELDEKDIVSRVDDLVLFDATNNGSKDIFTSGHFHDLTLHINDSSSLTAWPTLAFEDIARLDNLKVLDFNKDGRYDILGTSCDGVFYYEQKENSEFKKNKVGYESSCIDQINVGDFNGDGLWDILALNDGTNSFLFKYINVSTNSEIKFEEYPLHETLILDKYKSLIVLDFNNDKSSEIIYFSNSGVSKLIDFDSTNNAKETVLSYGNLGFLGHRDFILHDIDNDNDSDLILFSKKGLHVLENIGLGKTEFNHKPILSLDVQDIDPLVEVEQNSFETSLRISDFNNDGLVDILVLLSNSADRSSIFMISQVANREFDPPELVVKGAEALGPIDIADLDKDGYLDIVYANAYNLRIEKILNDGMGHFGEPSILINKLVEPLYIGSRDIDQDGDMDVFFDDNGISYALNENNNFDNCIQIVNADAFYTKIDFSDFDRNGELDLLYQDGSSFRIITNKGNLNFEGVIGENLSGDYLSSFIIDDINSDQFVDIISVNTFLENVNNPTEDGFERFQQHKLSENNDLRVVAVHDYNYDGVNDIVLAKNEIYIIYNFYTRPTFQGYVYFDENQNGFKDSSEFSLPGIRIFAEGDDEEITVTNENGEYEIYTEPYSDYVLSSEELENWKLTSPPSFTFYSEFARDTTFNFGYFPKEEIVEMESSVSTPILRCNMDLSANLVIRNLGTVPSSSTLHLEYESPLEFVGASLDPHEMDIGSRAITWRIDSLLPLNSQKIALTFAPISEQFIGESLQFKSSVYVSESTNLLSENFYVDTLRCAYDPNDKTGVENDNNDRLDAGEELTYTIRFQNTGNDTAFNIVIIDTLESTLNPKTFRPLGSSHNYTSELKDSILTFTFSNIYLPDSNINFEASNGFVQFRININEDVEQGSSIENTASIYFDNNPPILTNIAKNVLAIETSIKDHLPIASGYTVFPNPTDSKITIVTSREMSQKFELRLLDSSGKLIDSWRQVRFPFDIDLNEIPIGIYFIEFLDSSGALVTIEKLSKI